MHVGWAATFDPPRLRRRPDFDRLRDHIESRLPRAPRYRQKIIPVPLGLNSPAWVDDRDFEIANHVIPAQSGSLTEIVDACMSRQLDRRHPLWEICIADRLDDGRIGIVGKAHHCMVDGIAAVELASLLLDPTRRPPRPEPDGWQPGRVPPAPIRVLEAVRDRLGDQLSLLRASTRLASPLRRPPAPRRLLGVVRRAPRTAGALLRSARPAAPVEPLNEDLSPFRHVASLCRPLADLKRIKGRFGTTVNDVLLAAVAGGLRRFLERRGEPPRSLKTMVPVNVRDGDGAAELGNRISFMFVELPCDEPHPVHRLMRIQAVTEEQKAAREPEAADAALRMLTRAPRTVQRVASRLVASQRTFNLVVSNIPGPREPMYMLGCRLAEAYPVVPLADRHTVSIGMTTIGDRACFGVYADSDALPDADLLAADIDDSIAELIEA